MSAHCSLQLDHLPTKAIAVNFDVLESVAKVILLNMDLTMRSTRFCQLYLEFIVCCFQLTNLVCIALGCIT